MDTVTITKKEYGKLLKAWRGGNASKAQKNVASFGSTKILISLKGILKGITITAKDIAGARKSLFKAG